MPVVGAYRTRITRVFDTAWPNFSARLTARTSALLIRAGPLTLIPTPPEEARA